MIREFQISSKYYLLYTLERLIKWTVVNLKKKVMYNNVQKIYRETVECVYMESYNFGYASRLTLICTVGFNLVISRS